MHTVRNFECIGKKKKKKSKLTHKFMKMIDYNISYFASEFEIFNPWTALMFLIGL